MAFLNISKAKNILRNSPIKDYTDYITKGESVKICIDSEEACTEILQTGEYKIFKALDKAGRLLKESLLTRVTAHKKYDFSSIQSTSAFNLQELYKRINTKKAKDNKEADIQYVTLEDGVLKEIQALTKKLDKSMKKIQKIVLKNEDIRDYVHQMLGDDDCCKESLKSLELELPENAVFIDERKITKGKKIEKQQLKKSLKSLGIGTVASIGGGLLLGAPIVIFGVTATFPGMAGVMGSAICVGCGIAVGVGTAGIGLAVSASLAAGFLIAALVTHCNKERFGKIVLKKAIIQVNDEFRKSLKYINKIAFLSRNEAEISDMQQQTPTNEQKGIISDFVSKQNKLWKLYITADETEDVKSGENINNKHESNPVKDKKTSTIKKMKVGVSKAWAEMQTENRK